MKITGLQEFAKSVKDNDGSMFVACASGTSKDSLIDFITLLSNDITDGNARAVCCIVGNPDCEIEFIRVLDGND